MRTNSLVALKFLMKMCPPRDLNMRVGSLFSEKTLVDCVEVMSRCAFAGACHVSFKNHWNSDEPFAEKARNGFSSAQNAS